MNLCLPCARRKLAGKPQGGCKSCVDLNIDLRQKIYEKAAAAIRDDAERAFIRSDGRINATGHHIGRQHPQMRWPHRDGAK